VVEVELGAMVDCWVSVWERTEEPVVTAFCGAGEGRCLERVWEKRLLKLSVRRGEGEGNLISRVIHQV